MSTEHAVPAILQRLLAASLTLCLACPGASQPDIVIVMADDMGFSDPACFGGEIPTPRLDQLAASGLRLTHCRNAGMCVTSRASLLSGRWWPTALRSFTETDLLPEKLHATGYRTALIGKWHLNGHPLDHGFDHFFGFLGGFADHFAGSPDYRLDRRPFRDFKPDDYSTVNFTDRAIHFVETTPPDQPMFFQHADNRAIRTANRTLVEVDGGGWELYDTLADPLEVNDIIGKHPDETAQLAARWEQWWSSQNGGKKYSPESTADSPHYSPQGDRGSGNRYQPSEMPPKPSDP